MKSLYNFFSHNELLNSSFLLAVITLLAAGTALYIYRKQHRDERQEAAKAIYSEIVSAQNRLKGIRERFFAEQFPALESETVLRSENWSRYKYLFVQQLTTDEWNLVDRFYNNCLAYDAAVALNNSYFDEEVKYFFDAFSQNYRSVLDAFHKANPKGTNALPKALRDDLQKYQDRFLNTDNRRPVVYRPQKPINDARVALVALDSDISLSSAGVKLRAMARLP